MSQAPRGGIQRDDPQPDAVEIMPYPNATKQLSLIITELNVGGAERCLTHLATRLDPSRFAVRAISLAPRPSPGKDELVRMLEDHDIPIDFIGGRSIWQAPFALLRLMRCLRRHRPDIVQTFLFHANLLGALAARMAGIRHVTSSIRVADPRKSRRIERAFSHLVERIVCVSESVAQFAAGQGFPAEKLIVIPNGVDTARFHLPSDLELEARARADLRRVIFVGRLDLQKGVDLLLEAWQRVENQLPECELVLVGEGPARGQLEETIRQKKLDRVQLLGARSDIPALLRQSHVFVLPSRWEGMPNALLEAMASGLPVVASRVEGVEEILGDSAAKQGIQSENVEALAERLTWFATHVEESRAIGRMNRERVEKRFSLTSMVQGFESVYADLFSAQLNPPFAG